MRGQRRQRNQNRQPKRSRHVLQRVSVVGQQGLGTRPVPANCRIGSRTDWDRFGSQACLTVTYTSDHKVRVPDNPSIVPKTANSRNCMVV